MLLREWVVPTQLGRSDDPHGASSSRYGQSILVALALVAATTLCLLGVTQFIHLHHVSSTYLIPVLIAATRLGVVPAIAAAVGGIAASAFFFYPPIYDFRVSDPKQLLDLPLFVIVATVTGQLAANARAHAMLAQQRENDMRALYTFSKRLAVATDETQIYSAIQDHLSAISGCRVAYFEAGAAPMASRRGSGIVPETVQRAVEECAKRTSYRPALWLRDDVTNTMWMIRAVTEKIPAFGIVAIDTGRASRHEPSTMQTRIDAVLADASATLERLDVARAIGEAKLRTEAETLRAALMGSVSHGLRTPLSSIMGSASILVSAPAIVRDPRLADLAAIIKSEAERLNSDIQRLLDASRISSAGVRPRMSWADAADIVNAAVVSQGRSLAAHRVAVRVADDLPLINVDPVLIEQALGQILDNAAKYSPNGSSIRIDARSQGGELIIAVSDDGAGVIADEASQMFDRFYRGARTRENSVGSGLGLWIARAFVVACGGQVDAASEGIGHGSTITIRLPTAEMTETRSDGELDD
jgi:two-component system sensor histidine kinase KdpD